MNNKHLIYGFCCVTVLLALGLSAGRNKKRADAPKPDQTEEEDVTRKPRRESDVSSDAFEESQAEEQIDQAEKERRASMDQVSKQFFIAENYYIGFDIAQDYQKARIGFEAVANQEIDKFLQVMAKERLGEMYYFGQGVVQDYARARGYLEEVYQKGEFGYASLYLGEMYYFGLGVAQNYQEARIYFEGAANQEIFKNNPVLSKHYPQREQINSKLYLGEIYYWGRGVPQDYSQARKYFEEVAQQNSTPDLQLIAIKALGTMRHLGQGFEEQEGAEIACAICLGEAESDNPLKQLPCRNYHPVRVHTPCIAEAMERDKKCPICRSEMGPLVMPEHLVS